MLPIADMPPEASERMQLDGINGARWLELAAIWRRLDLPAQVSALNFLRELERGGESARTIGLGEALAEVDRVIAFNQSKHPGSKWKTQTVKHHCGKLLKHLGAAQTGERFDPDTKRNALAHVVARALMALGLELVEDMRR